jgi:GNAT superfamily N-acetyltransferase
VTVLRPANPLDAGRVGAILSAWIDETPWMPRVHTRAEDIAFADMMVDRGWVTVSETAEDVLGFIARDGDDIHALYIDPEARGQGIGSALLASAMRHEDQLTLWTFQANTRAQAFYERHGFAPVERTDGSGNDEGLPDIRYHWQRTPS